MEVFYEDNDIIVCVKQAGASSEDGPGSVPEMIRRYYAEKGTETEVFTVHRLDNAVGGLMVYARTKKAAAGLSEQIADGTFVKEYDAVVHGRPEKDEDVFKDLLFKDSGKNKTFVVKRMRKGVREAELSYRVIETAEIDGEIFSHVRIILKTGRSHQIRVQFASRKMPLAGDGKYGAKDSFGRIALESTALTFAHPVTGKKMKFEKDMGKGESVFSL